LRCGRADLYPNLFRIWSEAEVVELFGSDQEHCFVAEQGGKVVGFCLGTIIEKERNSWRCVPALGALDRRNA
jgi:ribosomal protein S18 acetylase RimI-like enzyme